MRLRPADSPNPSHSRVDMAQPKSPPVGIGGEPLVADEDTLAMLETCGAAQCSTQEVAAILGARLGEAKRFLKLGDKPRAAFERGRATGLKDLREAQIALAKKSVPMATLLGRLYLGQSEQQEQDERPKSAGHGSVDRLKRELSGIIAEATAAEGGKGDP